MRLISSILTFVCGSTIDREEGQNVTKTGEKSIGGWFGNSYILEYLMRGEKDRRVASLDSQGEHPSTLCMNDENEPRWRAP